MSDKKSLISNMWIEKFRPKSLKDVLLPSSYQNYFKTILESGELPNIILASSSPGTGKTSIAKALCADLDMEYLFINASSKNGIDVIRTEVTGFAVSKSFSGKKKVVVMDEAERLTPQTQDSLKSFLEEVHKTCRFIFTSNHINKLIEPLKSRCQTFSFDMTTEEAKREMVPKISKRLINILKFEGVDHTEEVVYKLVDQDYPDIRKMTGKLQQFASMHSVITENILRLNIVDDELFEYILERKFTKARQYILDSGYSFDDLYSSFYRELVPKLRKESQGQAIITIADWQYKSAFSIDKELPLMALIMELFELI